MEHMWPVKIEPNDVNLEDYYSKIMYMMTSHRYVWNA